MRPRHSRPGIPADWPPTIRYLVRAAAAECPRGHAETLRDLSALALRKVPARGIFDPGARSEHELFTAIETVARAHLDLRAARAGWSRALHAAQLELERRDAIERAALRLQGVYDTAYFYAGLSFGVAAGWIHRPF